MRVKLSGSIDRNRLFHGAFTRQAKHFFQTGGWKKFELLWKMVSPSNRPDLAPPMQEAAPSRFMQAPSEGRKAQPASGWGEVDVLVNFADGRPLMEVSETDETVGVRA
jgi:hypothetical protein